MENINLIYVPMENTKTTNIGVYIHRNLNRNDVSENAVLPHVLRQGCGLCKNREEMSKYLENLYGASLRTGVVKFGDDQIMRIEAQTIADRYAAEHEPLTHELLKLILSIIFDPVTENGAFVKSVVEIEKKNARDRIASAMNDKRSYAMHRCIEEMCGGESFALSANGTEEGTNKISAEGLYEYYKKAIASSVIDIYVCGSADRAELERLISDTVKNIKFVPAKISKSTLHKNGGEIKNITERLEVNQGKISIGFVTGIAPEDKDYYALTVMNSIFGAGAHSKLFNNVREKLSLAYYASSSLVRAKGLMTVNAGIEFENFDKAYNETLAQLEAIKSGEISELEYTSSVRSILNTYESYKDDPEQLHDFMAVERVYGTNHDIDYVKNEISKVTIDDVIRVSKNISLDTVYFLTGKETE